MSGKMSKKDEWKEGGSAGRLIMVMRSFQKYASTLMTMMMVLMIMTIMMMMHSFQIEQKCV